MYKTRKSRRNFANNKDLAPLSFPHLDLVPAFVPDMIAYINASPSVFKQKFTLDWVEKAQKIPLNILSNPLENSDHDSHSPSDGATTGDQDSLPDSVDHAPPLNNIMINTVPRKYPPPFKPLLTSEQLPLDDQNFEGLSPIHYDPNVQREIIYDAKQGGLDRNQHKNKMIEEEVQNDGTDHDEDDDEENTNNDDDDNYSNDAENWRKKRRKGKQHHYQHHHHHHHHGRKLRLPTPSPSRSNLLPPPIPKKILQDQEVKRTAFPQLHQTLSLKRRQKSKNKSKIKSENINNRGNFVHKMKSFVVQHIQRNSSTIINDTTTVNQVQTKMKKRSKMGKKASLKNEEDANITQQLKNKNRKSIRSIKGQLQTHKDKRKEQQQEKTKIIPFNKKRVDLPTRFKGKSYDNGQTTTTTTTTNNYNKNPFLPEKIDPGDFEPTVTHNETGDDDDDDDSNNDLNKNKNGAERITGKKQELNEGSKEDLKGDAVSSRKIGVKTKRSTKKKMKRPFPTSTVQNNSPPWRIPWGPINKKEEVIVNTFLEQRMKKKTKKPELKKKRGKIPRNKIFPEEDFLDDDDEDEEDEKVPEQKKFQTEYESSVKGHKLNEDEKLFFGVEKNVTGVKKKNMLDFDSKSSTSSLTDSPYQKFPSRKRRSKSRSRSKKPKRQDSLSNEKQQLQRPTPSFYHGIQVHNLFHRDLEESEASSTSFLIGNKELLQTQNKVDKEDPNSFLSPPPLKNGDYETPQKTLAENIPSKKVEEGQKRPKDQPQPLIKKEMTKSTRKKGMKKYYGKFPENPRLALQLLQNKSIKNGNRTQHRKLQMQMQSPIGHLNHQSGMHLKHLHLQGGEGTPRNDPGNRQANDDEADRDSGTHKDKVSDADALLISQGVGSELYSPFEQLPSPNDNDLVKNGKAQNAQDTNKKEENPEKDIIFDYMKGHRDQGSDISSSFPFPAREFDYVQRIKPSLARNPRLKWNNKPKPLHLYFESKIMPNKRNYKNVHTLAPLNRREQILKYEFEDNESIVLPQMQEFQFNFSQPDDINDTNEKTREKYYEEENKNISAYRFQLSDTSTAMMHTRSHPNLQSTTRTSVDDDDDDERQSILLEPKPPFNSKEQIPIFSNNIKNNNNSINSRPILRSRAFRPSRKMRSKKTRVRQT